MKRLRAFLVRIYVTFWLLFHVRWLVKKLGDARIFSICPEQPPELRNWPLLYYVAMGVYIHKTGGRVFGIQEDLLKAIGVME